MLPHVSMEKARRQEALVTPSPFPSDPRNTNFRFGVLAAFKEFYQEVSIKPWLKYDGAYKQDEGNRNISHN